MYCAAISPGKGVKAESLSYRHNMAGSIVSAGINLLCQSATCGSLIFFEIMCGQPHSQHSGAGSIPAGACFVVRTLALTAKQIR